MRQTNSTQLLIGLAGLLFGTMVYLLARPPEHTFVHSAISLSHLTPAVFGVLGHSLPTFAHVFAFSLLTAGLLGGGKKTCFTICLSWFLVDAAFEFGQHAELASWLAKGIPPWFEKVLILDKTDSYFLYGTFDPWDVLSIVLGALAAYLVIQRTQSRRANYE